GPMHFPVPLLIMLPKLLDLDDTCLQWQPYSVTANSEITPNYANFPAVNRISTFQNCSYTYLNAHTCAVTLEPTTYSSPSKILAQVISSTLTCASVPSLPSEYRSPKS
uniref:Uncharacterized protein n=1 Tax=Zonotrichia albicollis TaxID=44394 RepID=A0A8D2QKM2_ZONAL